MLLYLVRHAQSEGNAGLPGATKDSALTALGRRQATAVAERIATLGVNRVLASPYIRALETAEAIRQATGAPAEVVPLLHEHHIEPFAAEEWPLLSRTALGERFPSFALPADFAFGPGWHEVPETEAGVLRRAGRVLEDLWARYGAAPDGNQEAKLALVSHGSPTGKLLIAALGLASSPHVQSRLRIDNASISVIDYWPDFRVLVASNRTDHLTHLGVDPASANPGYTLPRRPPA